MTSDIFADGVPRPAAWLGAAGVIPFAAGALGAWSLPAPWDLWALQAQVFYGACILSFMGAVHWGLAMADYGAPPGPSWQRLGGSVVPALLAWGALLLTPVLGLAVLILTFAGLFMADLRAAKAGLAPAWYPRLRKPLTLLVILSLGASLIRLF